MASAARELVQGRAHCRLVRRSPARPLEQIVVGRSGLLDHFDPYRARQAQRLLDRLARQRHVKCRWAGRANR
jgi:hypothetical protein